MDGTEVVVVGGLYVYGPMHMETRAQYSHGSTCRRNHIIIIIIHNNGNDNDNHQYMSPATPHAHTPSTESHGSIPAMHNALCVSTLFSVSIYQPFSVLVVIPQPSTFNHQLPPRSPCSPCPCIVCLPCFRLRGPHFLTSSTLHFLPLVPRPCPTTSLPLQPRAPPRFTLCDIRTIFSADLHMHMRNEVFTSLPAPPPSSGAWPWLPNA